jgi:OOP family OmpA-OmpF porin
VDERGCPQDADGDGVCDEEDRCSNTPRGSPVDAHGCVADEDGDGVADAKDRCPGTTRGTRVDANGCPQSLGSATRGFDANGRIRLRDIPFAGGRDEVLPGAYYALDRAGEALAAQPAVRVEIVVTGRPGDSQSLSRARAAAVLAYLTGRFPDLDARRFTTRGVAGPKGAKGTGTALRTVDFVALNPEAIKRKPAPRSTSRR